jgi:L-cysteine/cystine lyase
MAAMTDLETLTRNVEALRCLFPALTNKVYMNFGAQGVMAKRTLAAIPDSYKLVQEKGPLSMKMFGWLSDELRQTRREIAEEFAAPAETIALTQNTTDGCNIGMWGVKWRSGDDLLLTDAEHPGVVAAAFQLAKRERLTLGFCPVTLVSPEQVIENFKKRVTSKTKLVVLSHVLWNTGEILPLDEIIEVCHKKGALVLVDGAQSAGVLDLQLDKSKADMYAMSGHKWIGAPDGLGALYVSKEALLKVEPIFVGWRGSTFNHEGEPTGWETGSVRFEGSTAPFALLSPFRTALKIRREHGTAAERYSMLLSHSTKLWEALATVDNVKRTCNTPPAAGLVSFTVKGKSHKEVCEQLESRNIILRTIPKPDCIRASIHYFTGDTDRNKLIEALRQITAS